MRECSPDHVSHFICHMSCVMWCSKSVEGLLSTGHTTLVFWYSVCYICLVFLVYLVCWVYLVHLIYWVSFLCSANWTFRFTMSIKYILSIVSILSILTIVSIVSAMYLLYILFILSILSIRPIRIFFVSIYTL